MKNLNTLFFVLLLLSVNSIKAAETEPNNSKATANVLTLNGNNTGAINVSGDEDWWKITTNLDGKLNITITVSNSLNLRCYIYDNDGTTLLEDGYTSTTKVISKDGLAAGSYYIKLVAYYSGQLPVYSISNSLTIPAQANDDEPNDIKTQAEVLPLNKSKTGHINYYYNNKKDTLDWYKVTTNEDGRLRLTLSSANGQNVRAYLYDNNGTILLDNGYTSGTAAVVNKDGLAAGTYYIMVKTYYTSEFAPYTISDSLFTPDQASDAEPNDSRDKANVLPLNGSKTGHTNYYYNNKKDTADWYKLTTNEDGMITINIQSHNGQNVWAYLYDNNGTTLLESAYTSSAKSFNYDGLMPGTYYVRVKTYYTSEWAPYTLSNTLTKYTNDADEEPNDYFSQAKTIDANSTSTGHAGFYYNGVSDAVDYYKINYTAKNGNLTLQFNQENRLSYGNTAPTYFRVYKDTAASPIFSNYYYDPSGDINLTNLKAGYYYIKVNTYYTGAGTHFSSYSIKNTFQQVKAGISILSYDANVSCSANSITYKLSKSSAPYSVQLYRYGIKYGNAKMVNSNKADFLGLPQGSYSATVFGDGATGSANGTSDILSLIPSPTNTGTTAIKTNQAKLTWKIVPCAAYYSIQYRVQGTTTWSTKPTTGNTASYILKGLASSTSYEWKIAAVDSENDIPATSDYTAITAFKTKGSNFIEDNNPDGEEDLNIAANKLNTTSLMVAPNPATSYFIIHYNTLARQNLSAALYNVNGKPVWTSGSINTDALNGKKVMVNQFGSGLYYLKITDAKGVLLGNAKVSIAK